MFRNPTDTPLNRYLRHHGGRENPVLEDLRHQTAALGRVGMMQVSPEQGGFLAWLVEFVGAKTVLEVGCFTGYSALCMAAALPDDGRLITCDISGDWTTLAQAAWGRSDQAKKIQLYLAPAAETLADLISQNGTGRFDLAFIDADKTGYDGYFEQCLKLVRPGGIIAIDNTLWSGLVADSSAQDESTIALRALNDKVRTDPRVSSCLLPIGDGLTLLRVIGTNS